MRHWSLKWSSPGLPSSDIAGHFWHLRPILSTSPTGNVMASVRSSNLLPSCVPISHLLCDSQSWELSSHQVFPWEVGPKPKDLSCCTCQTLREQSDKMYLFQSPNNIDAPARQPSFSWGKHLLLESAGLLPLYMSYTFLDHESIFCWHQSSILSVACGW